MVTVLRVYTLYLTTSLSVSYKDVLHLFETIGEYTDLKDHRSPPCYLPERYMRETHSVNRSIALEISYYSPSRRYFHKLQIGNRYYRFMCNYPTHIDEHKINKKITCFVNECTIQIFFYVSYQRGYMDYIVRLPDGRELKKEKFFSNRLSIQAICYDIIRDVERDEMYENNEG